MGDGPLGYLSPTSDWMCTRRRSASRLPRAAATVTCARSGFREPSRASDEAGSLAEQRGSSAEFCKEAGPSGYGLHRPLTGCGHECVVVASSLIPVKAGDRVKTDRRDAVMLAKLHRAGELTSIWIPDAAHEPCATPACAGAGPGAGTGDGGPGLVQGTPASAKILAPPRSDLSRSSCLDAGYRRWLTTVRFAHPAQQIVLQDYIHAVQDAEARLERLTRQIEELLPSWSMAPVVAALQAMRGPDSCSHRRVRSRRLSTLRQCAAADGLSRPGAHRTFVRCQRPARRHHQGRQCDGTARADRGAWTYRMPARVSRKLHDRNEKLLPAIRDIAWKGQIRLCTRYRRLAAPGKPKVVVTTAIAREMVGFI